MNIKNEKIYNYNLYIEYIMSFFSEKPQEKPIDIDERISQTLESREQKATESEKANLSTTQIGKSEELESILKADKSQELRDIILESIAVDFYKGDKLRVLIDKFPLSKQSYDSAVDNYIDTDLKIESRIKELKTVNGTDLSDAQKTGLKNILKSAAKSVTVNTTAEREKSINTIFTHIEDAQNSITEKGRADDVLKGQCGNSKDRVDTLNPVVIYDRITVQSNTAESTPTHEYIFLETENGAIGDCKNTRYNITYENGDYKDFTAKFLGFMGGRKSRKSAKKARRKTSRK